MKSPLHLGEATNAARQICHSYALLQGSDHSYGTGIKTTCIRQAEFDSGEWQTVSRGLGIYLHSISLIYSNILCMIWNGNVLMQKKLIRKIIEKMASYLCNYKCDKKQQFCTFDENVDRTDE